MRLAIPLISTADKCIAKYGGHVQDLGNYITHNVTWYSTSAMASIDLTVLETQASTESNRHGTNIPVVEGTAHSRLKLRPLLIIMRVNTHSGLCNLDNFNISLTVN